MLTNITNTVIDSSVLFNCNISLYLSQYVLYIVFGRLSCVPLVVLLCYFIDCSVLFDCAANNQM